MDEDAAWYGNRPQPRPHCTRRGPSSRERGTAAPLFSAYVYCGHGRPSQLLLSSCYVRYMLSPSIFLSSVCNVRAAYAGGCNFRQYFYGIWCLGHPLTSIHGKFFGYRPRGTPLPGELNTKGVAIYSDFGPIEGYISKTVQDRK